MLTDFSLSPTLSRWFALPWPPGFFFPGCLCCPASSWGYFIGGTTSGTPIVTADKFVFTTELGAAQTTANFVATRFGHASFGDAQGFGYWAGGSTGVANVSDEAEKTTFSTDTTAAMTSLLTTNRNNLTTCGMAERSTKGYVAGGTSDGSTLIATVDKYTISSDTFANSTSAALSAAKLQVAAMTEGSTKGYWLGGATTAPLANADKITFSSDTTAATTTANLSQARYAMACGSDGSSKGFCAGGRTLTAVSVTTTDKTTFSSDSTAAATTANLASARREHAGMSQGADNMYVAGGNTLTNGVAVIDSPERIAFSTEVTTALTNSGISVARRFLATVSDVAL